MKKFFSKKPVKVIISIFIVFVLIVCICNAVFASVALDFQKGVAVCDEWSPDDVYTPDYAQSLEVGEEDYKILCLTDIHIRNHGTFASWLGINFILDGMSEIQLKKLINRVEPNLFSVITIMKAEQIKRNLQRFMRHQSTACLKAVLRA